MKRYIIFERKGGLDVPTDTGIRFQGSADTASHSFAVAFCEAMTKARRQGMNVPEPSKEYQALDETQFTTWAAWLPVTGSILVVNAPDESAAREILFAKLAMLHNSTFRERWIHNGKLVRAYYGPGQYEPEDLED